MSSRKQYTIEIVIDRIVTKDNIYDRLIQSLELAYKVGKGSLIINQDERIIHIVKIYIVLKMILNIENYSQAVFLLILH